MDEIAGVSRVTDGVRITYTHEGGDRLAALMSEELAFCRERAAHRYDNPDAPVATCLDCHTVRRKDKVSR